MSRLDLIVGPNGAGKTTLFERVIFPGRPGLSFVNADDIAAARFGDAATQISYVAADISALVWVFPPPAGGDAGAPFVVLPRFWVPEENMIKSG